MKTSANTGKLCATRIFIGLSKKKSSSAICSRKSISLDRTNTLRHLMSTVTRLWWLNMIKDKPRKPLDNLRSLKIPLKEFIVMIFLPTQTTLMTSTTSPSTSLVSSNVQITSSMTTVMKTTMTGFATRLRSVSTWHIFLMILQLRLPSTIRNW